MESKLRPPFYQVVDGGGGMPKVERSSDSLRPVFYYKSATASGIQEVSINSRGQVENNQVQDMKPPFTDAFVFNDPVKVISIDGRAIDCSVSQSFVDGGDKPSWWFSLMLKNPLNPQAETKLYVPAQVVLDGLGRKGHRVASYSGEGPEDHLLVHTLVLPAAKDPPSGAGQVRDLANINYVLVFNPVGEGPLDKQTESSRTFNHFETEAIQALIGCFTDNRRKSILLHHFKHSEAAKMEASILNLAAYPREVSTVVSRMAKLFDGSVKTVFSDLPIQEKKLIVPEGNFFKMIEALSTQSEDGEIKTILMNALAVFKDQVDKGLYDRDSLKNIYQQKRTQVVAAQKGLVGLDRKTSHSLGFAAVAGYDLYLASLEVLMNVWNQSVRAKVEEEVYPTLQNRVEEMVAQFIVSSETMRTLEETIDGASLNVELAKIAYEEEILENPDTWLPFEKPDALKADIARAQRGVDSAVGSFKNEHSTQTKIARGIAQRVEQGSTQVGSLYKDILDEREVAKVDQDAQRLLQNRDATSQRDGTHNGTQIVERASLEEQAPHLLSRLQQRVTQVGLDRIRLFTLKRAVDATRAKLDQYPFDVYNQTRFEEKGRFPTSDEVMADLLTFDGLSATNFYIISENTGVMRRSSGRRLGMSFWPVWEDQDTSTSGKFNGEKDGLVLPSEDPTRPAHLQDVVTGILNSWEHIQLASLSSVQSVFFDDILRKSLHLGLYDTPEDWESFTMSRVSWMMEMVAQTVNLSTDTLTLQGDINNKILRNRRIVIPPLSLILSKIKKDELGSFAAALRVFIDNKGYTFDTDRNGIRVRERNAYLREVAEFTGEIISRVMPKLDREGIEVNVEGFSEKRRFYSDSPREVWDKFQRYERN